MSIFEAERLIKTYKDIRILKIYLKMSTRMDL